MAREKRSGSGLLGVVAVAGVLTFTNAGNWLLQRTQELSANCPSMMPQAASAIGGPVCSGIASAVGAVTSMAEGVGNATKSVKDAKQWAMNAVPNIGGASDMSHSLDGAFAGLASSRDRLNEIISAGPQSLRGGNVPQQFQQAIDSFAIGQHYMDSGAGAAHAVPWLQQGAQQPNGFGILSQLTLGDAYRTGNGGIPANPQQAQAYYKMALQSLTQLRSGNTAQSQQMIHTLPVSPDVLHGMIIQSIRQVKGSK